MAVNIRRHAECSRNIPCFDSRLRPFPVVSRVFANESDECEWGGCFLFGFVLFDGRGWLGWVVGCGVGGGDRGVVVYVRGCAMTCVWRRRRNMTLGVGSL